MQFISSDGLAIDFNPAAKLEIQIRPSRWCTTTAYFFRSWAGDRRVNGRPYAGTVYYLGSNQVTPIVHQHQTA